MSEVEIHVSKSDLQQDNTQHGIGDPESLFTTTVYNISY